MALQLVLSDCDDLLNEKTVHLTYNNATILGSKVSLVIKYMYSYKVICSE